MGCWRGRDIAVTLLCWLYFTLGFVLFFSPCYLAAAWLSHQPEHAFQRYNRRFYQGFFLLLRVVAPKLRWQIDPGIAAIRSAVVVCNHRSYLDPLLLISLFDRARTIVKPVFFTLPIFGGVIRTAGYIPAKAEGRLTRIMLERLEDMGEYLAGGGTLFVFPEGTRNRQEGLGALHRGALKIARQWQVPVYVLCLEQTDQVFRPGKFLFSTAKPVDIKLHLLERFDPQGELPELMARVQLALNHCPSVSAATSQPASALPTIAEGI